MRGNLGAVKLMTTIIRLIEKPESMRSIGDATQREHWRGSIQLSPLTSRQRRRVGFDGSTLEPTLK
jgi:hypothetical protein